MAPRGPKMGSSWAPKSLKSIGKIDMFAVGGHLDPKIAQDGAKLAPKWPKITQYGPKKPQQGETKRHGPPGQGTTGHEPPTFKNRGGSWGKQKSKIPFLIYLCVLVVYRCVLVVLVMVVLVKVF